MQLAEFRDLVERQRGVLDQPHGGGFRHQRRFLHGKISFALRPPFAGEAGSSSGMTGIARNIGADGGRATGSRGLTGPEPGIFAENQQPRQIFIWLLSRASSRRSFSHQASVNGLLASFCAECRGRRWCCRRPRPGVRSPVGRDRATARVGGAGRQRLRPDSGVGTCDDMREREVGPVPSRKTSSDRAALAKDRLPGGMFHLIAAAAGAAAKAAARRDEGRSCKQFPACDHGRPGSMPGSDPRPRAHQNIIAFQFA